MTEDFCGIVFGCTFLFEQLSTLMAKEMLGLIRRPFFFCKSSRTTKIKTEAKLVWKKSMICLFQPQSWQIKTLSQVALPCRSCLPWQKTLVLLDIPLIGEFWFSHAFLHKIFHFSHKRIGKCCSKYIGQFFCLNFVCCPGSFSLFWRGSLPE